MKPTRIQATRFLSSLQCDVGEGPVWDERIGALYWVDITGGRLHRYVPETGEVHTRDLGVALGCAALTSQPGVLLLARNLELLRYDWDKHAQIPLMQVPDEPEGNRCNDGKPDPQGRFWFGTMEYEGNGMRGALHALSCANGGGPKLSRLAGPFGISNGLGWSPDGTTFYHIDSVQRRVDRYAFDLESGRLGPRETAVDLSSEPGLPDGMTVDAAGHLWVAFWGGGAVKCYAPGDAAPRVIVELPCAQVASCEFGGPHLTDLYITTARRGLSAAQHAAQPGAGGLFVCQPGTVGRPANRVGDWNDIAAPRLP